MSQCQIAWILGPVKLSGTRWFEVFSGNNIVLLELGLEDHGRRFRYVGAVAWHG